MTRHRILVASLAIVLAACSAASPTESGSMGGRSPSRSAGTSSASLTIYAAASLKAALARATSAYAGGHGAVAFTISTDSSAALETKIEQGAPADLFLSADTANPRKLIDKGLAAGSLVRFARNLLTIIVPVGNPSRIRTAADLARSGVKVIAAGDSVPITKYASQLVANLAHQPGYPPDFVAAYERNVASKEDNVAAVVSKIELGEGDAGIVYATDARTSARVSTIDVPSDANVPATYGGVVVAAAHNQEAAAAFLAWLAAPEGQSILASFGFLPAPSIREIR